MTDINSIKKEAIAVASALRQGKNIEVSEQIINLTQQIAAISSSLKQAQLTDLQTLLIEILAAQERQDWLAMADYLEYEISNQWYQMSYSMDLISTYSDGP